MLYLQEEDMEDRSHLGFFSSNIASLVIVSFALFVKNNSFNL